MGVQSSSAAFVNDSVMLQTPCICQWPGALHRAVVWRRSPAGTSASGQFVALSQSAPLFVHGCAHVAVQTGTVECWGAVLRPEDGPVCVASSGCDAAVSLRAVHGAASTGGATVSLPKATVTVVPISDGCQTSDSLAAIPGASFDGSRSPTQWDQACCCQQRLCKLSNRLGAAHPGVHQVNAPCMETNCASDYVSSISGTSMLSVCEHWGGHTASADIDS
jgi:hypothetical protein